MCIISLQLLTRCDPAFLFLLCCTIIAYQGKAGDWLGARSRGTLRALQMGVVPADSEYANHITGCEQTNLIS
jgi:hypothetical protein